MVIGSAIGRKRVDALRHGLGCSVEACPAHLTAAARLSSFRDESGGRSRSLSLNRRSVAGRVLLGTPGTQIGPVRAHDDVAPRSRHAPIGVLIRAHVMIVVPR